MFSEAPRPMFAGPAESPEPNRLRFRLSSDGMVRLELQAKIPGEEMASTTVHLDLDSREQSSDTAYERLLGDVIDGDARLFARADTVEQSWRIIQPVLDHPEPVQRYEMGSWGPEASSDLLPGATDWVPCLVDDEQAVAGAGGAR